MPWPWPPPGYQADPTGSQAVHGVQAVTVLDCVRHLSAVHQRILRLERVSEPVELLEPGIGVVLAVLGVTGNLDGDDVLGDVVTPVSAECGTEYPGADEGASRPLLAPARQFPLGEQPLVLRGLLGTDVNDDNVQLTHDGGSLGYPCADLGRRSRWVNPCRTARGHQPTRTRSAQLLVGVAGLAGMAVSLARNVERSRQAWLSDPPAGPLLGLAFERRASLPGPRRGVAQKRGASAAVIPGIGRARHGLYPRVAEGDAHGGGDDRGGSAQGLAHGGGDQRRRGAAGPAAGACLGCPGRAAAGVGAGVAGADLGGGRRGRAGSSAGPAAALSW